MSAEPKFRPIELGDDDQPLSPDDDIPPCTWNGHCDCYHLGEPCCNCGEILDDDIVDDL